MIITLLVFLGSILVLAGLHELGHFLAAKFLGVHVKEFAIGMGPKLVAFQGPQTQYSIRAFPIGGYVRMAGEDRQEKDELIPSDRILYNKPPYVRALISLAGPLANLVSAFLITLFIVWGFGYAMLQVADVIPGTPAAEVFLPGDRIVTMDDTAIFDMEEVSAAIQGSEGGAIPIDIVRDDTPMSLTITPTYSAEEERYILGAYFFTNTYTNVVAELTPTAPLRSFGVLSGDRILAVDDVPVDTVIDLLVYLEQQEELTSITLTVNRSGELLEISIPVANTTVEELFEGSTFADRGERRHRPGVLRGLKMGATQFGGNVQLLATWIRQLIAGEVAVGEAISGPVGVAQLLGRGARLGPAVFLNLLVFLSINFALLNLIPFPALDGSRIVFALFEWARGKPIAPEREGLIHAIGFLILIGVMILITYQDIVRIFR